MSWGSRTGRTRQFFGEGDFDFCLAVGQLVELQDITEAGPNFLLARIESGASRTWVKDIKETLRLGLVGAGMDREPAFRLVERHVKTGYLLKCAAVAVAVLAASYIGVEEERAPGEPKGEAAAPGSPTDASGLPISTEPQPQPV